MVCLPEILNSTNCSGAELKQVTQATKKTSTLLTVFIHFYSYILFRLVFLRLVYFLSTPEV